MAWWLWCTHAIHLFSNMIERETINRDMQSKMQMHIEKTAGQREDRWKRVTVWLWVSCAKKNLTNESERRHNKSRMFETYKMYICAWACVCVYVDEKKVKVQWNHITNKELRCIHDQRTQKERERDVCCSSFDHSIWAMNMHVSPAALMNLLAYDFERS